MVGTSSTGEGVMELWLDGNIASVPQARAASHDFIEHAGLPWSQAEDDLDLIVTELVSNACRHAPGPCRVRVCTSDEGVCTVEVWDTDPALPAIPPPGACTPAEDDAPPCGGYGLGIVALLSRELHVCGDWCGKTVRAVVAVSVSRANWEGPLEHEMHCPEPDHQNSAA
ncbi:ATP-binding protein [Streptomyces sp. 1222.5]|uniref:ATP-binding protein n=1 Tax=Streptomyces sp. 1222.5 TaxID=1881026 RepID=UPI003EB732BB